MKQRVLIVLVAAFFVGCLAAQKPVSGQEQHQSIKESKWKGFQRLDLKFGDRNARIVVPDRPAKGNPWLWRARFPDWHTEADSILLSEGYHIAYIDTDNLYGSPKAVTIWNSFYTEMTNRYKLHQKVALAGVSRGGLFVYNWAKKNHGKVACIYAEAPVCDFKSWPMGKSEQDWERLKQVYGFASDKEALAYTNNPINNLSPLAEAKIPLLHMVSISDSIVPYAKNTKVLVNNYVQLGGAATVVPCQNGLQLNGHHFDIETPRYVADFITYHTQKSLPLNAAAYHELRDGLQNSRLAFEREKKGRIAFLGGSITYNGGWRDSLMTYFKQRFPHTDFEFIAAGIPSMGSTPSAFRLQRDVLSKGPIDLLFVEAAVNDAANGRTTKEQLRAMEGIVRQLRTTNPNSDLVMMHFVDPQKMERYRKGQEPQVIQNHTKVAEHYGTPTINLAKEVTDRIDNGEFTWEKDFQNLHPSPFGQGVYASSMIQLLERAYSGHVDADDKITTHTLPQKLDELSYDNGYFIPISEAKYPKEWTIDSVWQPNDGTGTRANYVNVPMLIGTTPGPSIQLDFKGSAIGIAVAAGQDAGTISYRIDGRPWKEQNLFTKWSSHLHLPWYYTLANGLSSENHTLELRLTNEKDNRSKGTACRIRYFYVNR